VKSRLEPIEIVDVSAGLNKFASSQLVDQRELTDSENIRHAGAGRFKRRGGMGRFAIGAITPAHADVVSTTERYGRGIYPFIRLISNTTGKRAIVEPVSVINNLVHRCAEGITPTRVRLKTGNPVYSPVADVSFPWKPYNTAMGTLNYENNFANVGFGTLDNRIYMGSNLHDKFWTDDSGNPITSEQKYPYGLALTVVSTGSFAVGEIVTGGTSGAQGKIGYINSAKKTLFLYSWNGKPFQDSEAVTGDIAGSSTVSYSAEYGNVGLILDHDFSPTGAWRARKWGIDKPLQVASAIQDVAGNVEPGDYTLRFTFIRYEGGTMSGGDNPKLSGGELISESAPSDTFAVSVTVSNKKIKYSAWPISADPQVTHVRFYRDDGSGSGVLHHVADAALNATDILDNYNVETVQLELVLLDTLGFRVYGENGEYSGFVIESGKHRMFVAGNANYPNRVYITPNRVEHKFTEYFNSGFDITESPGESITAMKWWNNTLYVFLERSIYRMTEQYLEGFGVVVGHEIVTRGAGCSTRNGVLDMGDYLLIMTEGGLVRFNGTTFDEVPLTIRLDALLGKDLLNAQLARSDDIVYFITETSRTLNLVLTMKFSDGTFALGTDKLDSSLQLPEAFAFVPELTNFGNTVDDSDYMISILKNPNDSGVKYWIMKYDDQTENKDRLFLLGGDELKTIIVRVSPKVVDFGAFVQCTLEKLIAYISSCGDESNTHKAPTGEWLVRMYIDQAKDGSAIRYEEAKLKRGFDRNKQLAENQGDPIQPKYTKPFDATYKHQTGGNWAVRTAANALLADVQKILFEAALPTSSIGRIWKFIFVYEDEQNFEFNSFALKFVREEENV